MGCPPIGGWGSPEDSEARDEPSRAEPNLSCGEHSGKGTDGLSRELAPAVPRERGDRGEGRSPFGCGRTNAAPGRVGPTTPNGPARLTETSGRTGTRNQLEPSNERTGRTREPAPFPNVGQWQSAVS